MSVTRGQFRLLLRSCLSHSAGVPRRTVLRLGALNCHANGCGRFNSSLSGAHSLLSRTENNGSGRSPAAGGIEIKLETFAETIEGDIESQQMKMVQKELQEVVVKSASDGDFRRHILEIFQNLVKKKRNTGVKQLFSSYYTSVMNLLIVKGSPQLVDIHLEMFQYGLEPTIEGTTSMFSLGVLSNESYLPVILELYSIFPEKTTHDGNSLDRLLPAWLELKVPVENILPFIYQSNKLGRFPLKKRTLWIIGGIFDDATIRTDKPNIDFVESFMEYLSRKGPIDVPEPYFVLIIQKCALLGDDYRTQEKNDKDDLEMDLNLKLPPELLKENKVLPQDPDSSVPIPPIIDKIFAICEPFFIRKRNLSRVDAKKAKRKVTTGYFWESVIESYRNIPVDSILTFLRSKQIDLNSPRLLRALVNKQTTVANCRNMITKILKSTKVSNEYLDQLNAQLLRVIAKEHSQSGPQYVLDQYDYINKDRKFRYRRRKNFDPMPWPPFIHAMMYGCIEAASYSQAINIYRNFPSVSDDIARNLYVSALARSGNVKIAWQHIGTMAFREMSIKPETVSSIAFATICNGRRLNDESQHLKYSIKEIISKLKTLDSWGVPLPLKYCEKLFHELNNLSITSEEVKELLLALGDIYTMKSTTKTVWRKSNLISNTLVNELEISLLSDDVLINLHSNRRSAPIFSDGAISQLIHLGFFKNPSEPWNAVRLLHDLATKGIIIPRQPVMDALSEIISRVYGKLPADGVYKRVRQQLDPSVSVEKLIKNCNSAWKGDPIER